MDVAEFTMTNYEECIDKCTIRLAINETCLGIVFASDIEYALRKWNANCWLKGGSTISTVPFDVTNEGFNRFIAAFPQNSTG